MAFEKIILDRNEHIATLTLNRPEVMNALNEEMREELVEALTTLERDPDTRVLVLTGAGKGFSGGADLNTFKSLYERFRETGKRPAFGSPEFPHQFYSFSKPIVAAVNGVAVGWGMTMTLACDIRIASERARFRAAFVKVGVTPEFGSSYLLPRLIGPGRAAELVLTARMIDSEEALAMGLVNRVVPHEELLAEAESIARSIADLPPGAVTEAKSLLRRGLDSTLHQLIDYESLVFRERMIDQEHYDAVNRLLTELKSKGS
jgi:enoyl-CoA hydratase/carnithine racemase